VAATIGHRLNFWVTLWRGGKVLRLTSGMARDRHRKI